MAPRSTLQRGERKKEENSLFYELHKREIGKRAVVLGWYLASTETVHLLLSSSFLVTDIIVYGTFAVPSRITRMSVFSGDRTHTTCAV